MAIKIAIDAGHGLYTLGKRCLKSIDPNETREWTLNSRVASQVVEHLERCGAEVLRLDDVTGETDVALSVRTGKANSWGADYCVSIHHNAGINGGSGGGPVVFVDGRAHSAKSDVMQSNVYNALIAETGKFGNRSQPLAAQNLWMCHATAMPAILVEVGFMDSTVDTPLILTDEFAAKAARGIAKGICTTAALAWVEKAAETQTESNITTGGTCEVTLNTLRTGSKGGDVKALQLLLIGNGCSCGSCGADGEFGSATLAAVKAYQTARGLTVDGIVGKNTWGKLLGAA